MIHQNFLFFKKKTNETNLGGLLFIIYLIITLYIIFVYLFDYFYDLYNNNIYDIKSSRVESVVDYEKEKSSDDKINPERELSFEFYNNNFDKLSNNFKIFNSSNNQEIERNKVIKKRVSDINLEIRYYCEDKNCSLRENDKFNEHLFFSIYYKGIKFDHQTDGIPLENINDFFSVHYQFYFYIPTKRRVDWEIIKYNDESKGFMRLFDMIRGINRTYFAGLPNANRFFIYENSYLNYDQKYNMYYKFLGKIYMVNRIVYYIEYKRIKKGFLDVLANILALITSLYGVFGKSFSFFFFLFK